MATSMSLPRGCLVGVFAAALVLAGGPLCSAADPPRPAPFQTRRNVAFLSVFADGRPLLQYRYDGVPYKPYIKELFTPGGVQVLRDAPADHWHHHGLMFAVGVSGVSFWVEEGEAGRQVPRGLSNPQMETRGDVSTIRFTQRLDWDLPGEEKPVLQEKRTITVFRGPDIPATLLTWKTELACGQGHEQVELTGSHYYGLGMRFVQSMDGVGHFRNASGKPGEIVRGKERLVAARWCGYTAPAGRTPVTVALFDHPENVRHPAMMFTMPEHFAYQSATLNLWKEPLAVSRASPLRLVYGVALWDGEADEKAIESLYRRWVELAGKP